MFALFPPTEAVHNPALPGIQVCAIIYKQLDHLDSTINCPE